MNSATFYNISFANWNFTEQFLRRIGSSIELDSTYLFLISPIAVIGFLLNIISLVGLFKIRVRGTVLYNYLRIYTINSVILNIIAVGSICTYAPRYFDGSITYFSRVYRCIIFNYVSTTFYFFGNVMDILIVLERIAIFNKKVKKYIDKCVTYVCLII